MGFALALWVLISLLSVSLVGTHTHWALGGAALGGVVLGIYLWKCLGTRSCPAKESVETIRFFSWIYQHEVFFLCFPLLILFFSKRFPLPLSFCALFFLLFLWICRKMVTGSFTVAGPVDLPILLLLISSIFSLYASVDLWASAADVFRLFACMAFLYSIINRIDSEEKLRIALIIFIVAGVSIVLSIALVMQLPPAKLPLVSNIYHLFPDFIPRRIHYNYVGGTLTLFFPLIFWYFISRYRERRVWYMASVVITGTGLFLTQSRGSLLGTVVALGLTGAWASRWIRWTLPVLAVAGGFLGYITGGFDALLDPNNRGGIGNMLVGRLELWDRAVHIIQDFPFTGIGMRTFPVVTDLLYPLFLAGPNAQVPHAHNLYLQIAVDIGLPGFIAFCALLGAWGGMVWEILRTSRSLKNGRSYEILALGLAGGLLAHMVYSITDAITLGEKAGVVFWVVLGLTAVLWQRVRSEAARHLKTEVQE